jgi:hypothetical protein
MRSSALSLLSRSIDGLSGGGTTHRSITEAFSKQRADIRYLCELWEIYCSRASIRLFIELLYVLLTT